jgi:hypothetical protein
VTISRDGQFFNLPDTLTVTPNENMGGDYQLTATLVGYLSRNSNVPSGTYCAVKVNAPTVVLHVQNDPAKVDIDPPVIKSITFDKAQYKITETATISIEYEDKSLLCGFDAFCAPTVFLPLIPEVQNQTTKEFSHSFKVSLLDFHPTKNGVATLSLNLNLFAPNLKQGKYALTNLVLTDEYGNYTIILPDEPATFEITGLQ